MTAQLNWALLSTARITRALIPPLQSSERNVLRAVASRDLATAEAFAAKNGIPQAYGSYEALLADPAIDVIYVPLPNHLHAEWSIKALRAGKHVLCEKPLALTLGEVDAMTAAARQSGRVLMEAFMYRHNAQTLKIEALVASGAIGQVRLIRGAFSFTLQSDVNVRLVRAYGGGSLWDVGCYPVSYSRLLAGAPVVEAYGQQVCGRGGVDEVFAGTLRFANGVLAQFDCGFALPGRAFMEIIGSEGTLTIPEPYKPAPVNRVTLTRGGETETIEISGGELYAGEVENLADAILLGAEPRVSLADSRANVAALLALYRSAESGAPIGL
ncbi:MAG TPA: Gfo/Idh/MocA family oxidoreductase [Anaerolineales bacterium]|nr:Gfo/Idh/MocA family oxidoreductase [Anaerolineales bacterium]